jgi:hypothetical protein
LLACVTTTQYHRIIISTAAPLATMFALPRTVMQTLGAWVRRAKLVGIGSTLLFFSPVGCSAKLCDGAINPNNTEYLVDIDSLYSESQFYSSLEGDFLTSGTPSCNGADGLAPGAALTFKTTGRMAIQQNICDNVTAALISGPAGLTLQGNTVVNPTNIDTAKGKVAMYSLTDVSFGNCTGTMIVEFVSGPGNVFAPPIDGGLFQPVIMYRLFSPSTGTCAVCNDNFVVQFFDQTAD